MIEFGRTLRAAREAKGYTTAQIAELTHLAPSTVEGLEKEDFSGIAAPIYGRGFVKLYCEAVGLAPKPLVDEFMEIFSGNRDTEIKERPVPVMPPPGPEQEPAHGTEPDAPAEPEQEPCAQPEPYQPADEEPAPEPQPDSELDLFSAASARPAPEEQSVPRFSRYAAPIDQTRVSTTSPFSVPPAFWRIAALGVAAVAVLAILIFGARALYRATRATPAPEQENAAEQPQASARPEPVAQPAKREIQSVPALYID